MTHHPEPAGTLPGTPPADAAELWRQLRESRRAFVAQRMGTSATANRVGDGVSEMRIHYGPGYRVYFVQRRDEIVVLLAGGNKSTQAKDIKTALNLAREL